jgi:hypothetical protein
LYGSKQSNFNRILSAGFLRRAFFKIVSPCSLPFITTGIESLHFPSAGKYSSTVVFLHVSNYNSLTKNFPAAFTIGLSTSRLPAPVINTPSTGGSIVFRQLQWKRGFPVWRSKISAYKTKQTADAEHDGSHELAVKKVGVPAYKVGKWCKLFSFTKKKKKSGIVVEGSCSNTRCSSQTLRHFAIAHSVTKFVCGGIFMFHYSTSSL